MSETTKNLQERILEEYKEGASDVEIASLLQVPLKKFYDMCEEIPAFAKVVDLGRTLSHAWWLRAGRKNLTNKEFVSAMWAFNMKNRHNWRDKVDTAESSSSEPMNLEQAKAELERTLRRIAKDNPEVLNGVNLLNAGASDD